MYEKKVDTLWEDKNNQSGVLLSIENFYSFYKMVFQKKICYIETSKMYNCT